MDSEQFQKLLDVFNTSQQHLASTLASQISEQFRIQRSGNQNNPVSNVSPFETYDNKKEKFKNYLERFENYLAVKNVADDNKKAQLLSVSIGSLHYNNLSALLGPDKPIKNLDYGTLSKAFGDMLSPHRNVVVSQHYFLSTYQKQNETIAEFVAALQADLTECQFAISCECTKIVSVADIFLRAQFIRGLKDNWIREQLLQSDSTSFKDILTKATALEASRLETQVLTKQQPANTNGSTLNDVLKVSNTGRSRHDKPQFQKNRHRHRSKSHDQRQSKYWPRSKSKVDYSRLGIADLCFQCGRNNHRASDCRVDRSSLHCSLCNKEGHVSKVCISTLLNEKYHKNQMGSNASSGSTSTKHIRSSEDFSYGLNKITEELTKNQNQDVIDIYDQHNERDSIPDSQKYYVTILLNQKPMQFEVDSGAGFTLIPEDEFKHLNLDIALEPTKIHFRAYTNDIFCPRGKATLDVSYKGHNSTEEIYVVPEGRSAILGRVWIRHLKISLEEIDKNTISRPQLAFSNSIHSINDLLIRYSAVFEQTIGCVPNHKVSLKLRENAKPVYTRERNVPFALRAKVEEELNNLETAGIISKVDACDWGSPLVVIPKGNGTVRLCVDYKVGVNERLVSSNFPIRHIPDVLNDLRNSRFFCKLDIFKAYLHIPVDEPSSEIQAITTHRGTYRMLRLSFGIKTAPAEFNRILDQILQGLSKTEAYYDDIVVHGSTKEECLVNLDACLSRLQAHGLHLNKEKCYFFSEKIEYLGHIIEHNKISKSPNKVQAVMDMPRPRNVEEVRRFLGMITYYARFIPDLSTKTTPLRNLLCKNRKFKWSAECELSFKNLKDEMISDRVLVPYNPHLPIVLTCDASPTGIAAVMSHLIDGEERPISFASRSLTSSERNYSQLDREALAIVFGVSHFFNYLFGMHFILVTDNEPLTRIFHEKKQLPPMTSNRLLRYAAFLSGFNYTVRFKKGEANANVDCLSRASINQEYDSMDVLINNEVHLLDMYSTFDISSESLTAEIIAQETDVDEELSHIKEGLLNGTSESSYTLDDGVLFKNNRVVIPKNLQDLVLKELHATHIGISRMKQLARRYVYWRGIDQAIDKMVKTCERCALVKFNPPKAPLHPWEEPDENWQRIHIDYAGPYNNYHFLVCVDAKSKWIEVKILTTAPTTSNTINLLDNVFSSHGYPQVMVSDNASIFTSLEFKSYCSSNGIFQKFIAPGHAATNGLAERAVQTLKQRLKALENDHRPMHIKVQEILLHYRATPLSCGKSPAELYLHRNLRIKLDAIRPYHPSKNSTSPSTCLRSFKVGERVQARDYSNTKYIWVFGEIVEKLGVLHYIVKLDSGRTIKRHLDQIRHTLVKKVHFDPKVKADNQRPAFYRVPFLVQSPESPISTPRQDNNQPPGPATSIPEPASPRNIQRPTRSRRRPTYLRDYVE